MSGKKVEEVNFANDFPVNVILENGNVEPDDEWALFRLTDEGLRLYQIGYELASEITALKIGVEPAVVEIDRFNTEVEAREVASRLSAEEKARTLVRSVCPKS